MNQVTVVKIGGGTLHNRSCFDRAVLNIERMRERGRIVVVMSALYGVTDFLVENCESVAHGKMDISDMILELRQRHFDYLRSVKKDNVRIAAKTKVNAALEQLKEHLERIERKKTFGLEMRDLVYSFGERLGPIILEAFLLDGGVSARAFDSETAGIYCKTQGGERVIVDFEKTTTGLLKNVSPCLEKTVAIISGYYGIDEKNDVRTFGRGGTDYSAAFVAAIFECKLEIWKDVDGFMSADPKIIRDAFVIKYLTYDEAQELGKAGAKILHPRTMEPLRKKGIEIKIRNFFDLEEGGTIIGARKPELATGPKSIAVSLPNSFLRIYELEEVQKTQEKLFKVLDSVGIDFELVCRKDNEFSIIVRTSELHHTLEAVRRITVDVNSVNFSWTSGMALVSIIGEGVGDGEQLEKKILECLREQRIPAVSPPACFCNIRMKLVLDDRDVSGAIKSIHEELFG